MDDRPPARSSSLSPIGSRWFRGFPVFGNASFRLLFVARSLSAIGDAIVPVALVFAVLRLGGATDVGIVLGCQWGARVVLVVGGGVWADRLRRQTVMIAADLVRAAAQVFVAADFLIGHTQVWHLAGAASVVGAGSAFFNPASVSLVPMIVEPGLVQQANGALLSTRNLLGIVGPAVSGALIAQLGFSIVFAVDAATFVASAVCLTRVPASMPSPQRRRKSAIREALDGLRVIRKSSWLMATLAGDILSNLGLAGFFVLGPLVVKEHFGGARDWGFVLAAGAAGGLVGAACAMRLRLRRPLFVAYSVSLVVPLAMVALVPPAPLPAIVVGAAFLFFANDLTGALWTTMEQQHVPRSVLSRVDSVAWLASMAAFPTAMAAVGPVASSVGVTTTLVASAALTGLASVVALVARGVRELGPLEEEAVFDAQASEVGAR